MRTLPNPLRIPARQFVPMVLLLLGISGCGSGGGSTPPPATNLPPVANSTCPAILDFASSLNVNLSATDPNGDALTYTITTQTANGVVTPTSNNTGNFLYTPSTAGRHGMDRFTFTVTDSGGLTSAPATVSILNNGTVRIMPLGDSITEGVWFNDSLAQCDDGDPDYSGNCPFADHRVSYRKDLYNVLEGLSPNYAVDMVGSLSNGAAAGLAQPEHEGHPGWTAGQIATGISGGWLNTNPPDIILLHIGTNSFTTSSADVKTILDNINSWAQADYPVTVFVARIIQSVDNSLNVTAFNDDVANMIATNNWPYIRVMPMVNQQTGAGILYQIDTNPACLDGSGPCVGDMADNLHPNPRGYTRMATKWRTDLVNSTVLPTCP